MFTNIYLFWYLMYGETLDYEQNYHVNMRIIDALNVETCIKHVIILKCGHVNSNYYRCIPNRALANKGTEFNA